MEKGYNSDLKMGLDLYHIQTEDWGTDMQLIVTRVFKNGAVIKSYKTPYADLLRSTPNIQRRLALREALKNQHRKILDLLQSGQMFYKMPRIEL
ncbi:MAG: hypothetical protein RJB66_586 [Pseudomonadota bacterium]|jgi:hypothetical protein